MMRAAAIVLLLSGCAASVPLCDVPRPSWVSGDTYGTIEQQKTAAAVWDRRCTLLGAWR
jgi:hypothetical protein